MGWFRPGKPSGVWEVRDWLKAVGVRTLYIEPGSPWENGYVEIFDTLWEAKVLAERWRREYNQRRPHSALAYRPPAPEAQLPRRGTGPDPLEWTSNGPESNLEVGTTRGGRSVSSGKVGVGLGGPVKVIREYSPQALRHFTHFD